MVFKNLHVPHGTSSSARSAAYKKARPVRSTTNTQGRATFMHAVPPCLSARSASGRNSTARPLKKSSPQKFVGTRKRSRGTTLLGRTASRPAWTPLTEGQFGKCTPAHRTPFHSGSPGLARRKIRSKALSANGAFSLDDAKLHFRRIPVQRLSNRIDLLDEIIAHIFRLSSENFQNKRRTITQKSGAAVGA